MEDQGHPQTNTSSAVYLASSRRRPRRAAELYQRAVAAQRSGDWARYGEDLSQLGEVLRQLQAALGGRQP